MARVTKAEVLQGTLDLIVLKALAREPMHGWGIANRVRQLSKETFKIGQGSLYPALHRYERRGWVSSYGGATPNNRIARYYTLTAVGRRVLEEQIAQWRRYTEVVDAVIAAGELSGEQATLIGVSLRLIL